MSQQAKPKPRLGRGLNSLISVSNLPVQADVSHAAASGAQAEAEGKSGIESRQGTDTKSATSSPSRIPPKTHSEEASRPHATVSHDGTPLLISIDNIRPNPHQPRKTIRESAIAELAASMKTSGIIQPLVVKKVDGGYELIAGERRWLAAKLAGLADVPVVVRDVDGPTQAQMALVENIQREDLNPIERAQAYRTLMDQLGLTQAELANRMGEERSSIANFLRLLDLTEAVRQMVRDGRLSLGHAKLLAGVADILHQQKLAETVVKQELSVRNLERLLANEPVAPVARPAGSSAAYLADLEKNLTRQIGLRVQVKSKAKGKGRLILHYTSLDQFDDLLTKLGAKVE